MNSASFATFDPARVPSLCFVVDEAAVEHNLGILARVQRESGAKVLLALKAFSIFSLAPLISRYLSGTCASGFNGIGLPAIALWNSQTDALRVVREFAYEFSAALLAYKLMGISERSVR